MSRAEAALPVGKPNIGGRNSLLEDTGGGGPREKWACYGFIVACEILFDMNVRVKHLLKSLVNTSFIKGTKKVHL